jgi:2-phosphoglycerate kinase
MIYLIGGSPRAGKSTLSKALGGRLGCTFVSVDTLNYGILMTLKEFVPEFDALEMYQDHKLFWESGRDRNRLYLEHTSADVLAAHKAEARASWPFLKAWIERQIKFFPNLNLILEGYQLTPELIQELLAKHPNQIKYCLLVQTNPETILRSIQADSSPGNWASKPDYTAHTRQSISLTISLIGQFITEQAQKYSLDLVNTELNFEQAITGAIQKLNV